MKKAVLWYVAICAGALTYTAAAVLAVMYVRDIFTFARGKAVKLRATKGKLLARFLPEAQ
ncbi:MAG: hypothetical protein LBI44_01655 [Oscillospiraceae bacterium]|nr:hypothetical protein [Oscillospiraceae bacterium]